MVCWLVFHTVSSPVPLRILGRQHFFKESFILVFNFSSNQRHLFYNFAEHVQEWWLYLYYCLADQNCRMHSNFRGSKWLSKMSTDTPYRSVNNLAESFSMTICPIKCPKTSGAPVFLEDLMPWPHPSTLHYYLPDLVPTPILLSRTLHMLHFARIMSLPPTHPQLTETSLASLIPICHEFWCLTLETHLIFNACNGCLSYCSHSSITLRCDWSVTCLIHHWSSRLWQTKYSACLSTMMAHRVQALKNIY